MKSRSAITIIGSGMPEVKVCDIVVNLKLSELKEKIV